MDINIRVTLDASERLANVAATIVALASGARHTTVAARPSKEPEAEDESPRRFEEALRKTLAAEAARFRTAQQEARPSAEKKDYAPARSEEQPHDSEPKPEAETPQPEPAAKEEEEEAKAEAKNADPAAHHTTADLRALCNKKTKDLGGANNTTLVKVRTFLKNLLVAKGIKSFNSEITPELCDELYDAIDALELSMIA